MLDFEENEHPFELKIKAIIIIIIFSNADSQKWIINHAAANLFTAKVFINWVFSKESYVRHEQSNQICVQFELFVDSSYNFLEFLEIDTYYTYFVYFSGKCIIMITLWKNSYLNS